VRQPLIVLKFGGSVLADEGTLALAVHEIHRWRRDGHGVVAVVSALAGVTDALLARARAFATHPAPEAVAALVAVGEQQCAALLGLQLDAGGVPSRVLSPGALGLVADGDPLDATPVVPGVDGKAPATGGTTLARARRLVRLALAAGEVAIVPGFVARDRQGRAVLLGRGGSDLTALLLAQALGADRCRLVKDVDGLYEHDPARAGPPARRLASASWDEALATDGRIIQRKAVLFAREHRLSFELGCWNGTHPTIIGQARTAGASGPRCAPPGRPWRVALLGLGTVGGAVWRRLQELAPRVELACAAVRDPGRPRTGAPPRELLTTDVLDAAGCGADVVIEALGGIEPARAAIEAALRAGSDVVTANKAVLAAHGAELVAPLARACGRSLLWSAAAGGSTPVLAAVRRAARASPLRRVEAVLNGTTNFVLDGVAGGASWPAALDAARREGLAEGCGGRDLSGADAADKLVLLHHAATGRWLRAEDVWCTPVTPASVAAAARPGALVRQVASLRVEGGAWTARVQPLALPSHHPLHGVRREGNAALICTRDARLVVRGRGAGGGPTATAVVGDLLALLRRARREQPACHPHGVSR